MLQVGYKKNQKRPSYLKYFTQYTYLTIVLQNKLTDHLKIHSIRNQYAVMKRTFYYPWYLFI